MDDLPMVLVFFPNRVLWSLSESLCYHWVSEILKVQRPQPVQFDSRLSVSWNSRFFIADWLNPYDWRFSRDNFNEESPIKEAKHRSKRFLRSGEMEEGEDGVNIKCWGHQWTLQTSTLQTSVFRSTAENKSVEYSAISATCASQSLPSTKHQESL